MGNTVGCGYLQYEEERLGQNLRLIEVKLCIQIIREFFGPYKGEIIEKEFNKELIRTDREIEKRSERKYLRFRDFFICLKNAIINVEENFESKKISILRIEIAKLNQKIIELKQENEKILYELPIYLKI